MLAKVGSVAVSADFYSIAFAFKSRCSSLPPLLWPRAVAGECAARS